jgi:hypothetical protein
MRSPVWRRRESSQHGAIVEHAALDRRRVNLMTATGAVRRTRLSIACRRSVSIVSRFTLVDRRVALPGSRVDIAPLRPHRQGARRAGAIVAPRARNCSARPYDRAVDIAHACGGAASSRACSGIAWRGSTDRRRGRHRAPTTCRPAGPGSPAEPDAARARPDVPSLARHAIAHDGRATGCISVTGFTPLLSSLFSIQLPAVRRNTLWNPAPGVA